MFIFGMILGKQVDNIRLKEGTHVNFKRQI